VTPDSWGPQKSYPIDFLLRAMATADPPTTITVRTSTRRLLESMKRADESYDDLIQELADEYYPPELISELKKRAADAREGRVKGVSAPEMRRSLGL
jgi:predicted CopG family antitoxin